jgi:hypothetical protein
MTRVLDHRAALAIGLAAAAWAGPAWAAADYYLKIGDIKGEAAASAAGADDRHRDWIELSSLRFADEAAATGGVRVATGDVDGDGRADVASGLPTGKRQHKPVTISKSMDKSSPKLAEGRVAAPGAAEPAALLLPAVQRVREAAARVPAWRGCAVGQHIATASLREGATGRTARVLDARVTECGAEQVGFTFSKVIWDSRSE